MSPTYTHGHPARGIPETGVCVECAGPVFEVHDTVRDLHFWRHMPVRVEPQEGAHNAVPVAISARCQICQRGLYLQTNKSSGTSFWRHRENKGRNKLRTCRR